MREEAFREWLEKRGAESDKGFKTRIYAVRTIEANMARLGSRYTDLDSAWAADRFAQLSDRMATLRKDAQAGGQMYRILMPQSTNPLNRLSSWRSWLGQYGQFLGGEPLGDSIADRIRVYVLETYIEPAREEDRPFVDVRVRDVNDALGLTAQWLNICQAMRGRIFLDMADLAPPQHTGADMSSATVFRFSLDTPPTEEVSVEETAPPATNLILYGPPGTGKTFRTAAEAVRLCGEEVVARDAIMAAYRRLCDAGRIEFVTFHQSTAYEEFVEGLRPTQGTEGSAGFKLRAEPGVFRRIARRAETSTGSGDVPFSISDRRVFKMSIGNTLRADEANLFHEAVSGGYTLLGWDDIDWSDDRFAIQQNIIEAAQAFGGHKEGELTGQSGRVRMPFDFRNKVKRGDIIVVSKGNSEFRAIGEVTGDYEFKPREGGTYAHRRGVNWLWVDGKGIPVNEIYDRDFQQSSLYELNKTGLNIPALERYIVSQQGGGAPEPFVLIIDEINRANISKVFGELITLLEPDKRLGEPNEIKVRLPYSEDIFGVPSNLHIIGTMNTADRSIALLDTALRRRFTFEELMPDASLLKTVDGIDLQVLLTTLNERIEYLFDREHQIGHAYFMGCRTKTEIDAVMRHKVIPLLAEYFYEDWGKVAMVLGDDADGDGEGGFLDRRRLKPPKSAGDQDGAPRYRWTVRKDAFRYDGITGA